MVYRRIGIMQHRKRMVGVEEGGTKIAVGVPDANLTTSTLELVQGVAMGYNDDGDLVGAMEVNGLSGERQEQIALRMIQAGMKILEGHRRLAVH